jgi:hypothetical protein
MSIVSEIMRYATPMLVDRIASALGVNSTLARTALSYALPSVLGAFTSKASTPAGASALFNAVKGVDPNMLGSLEGMLGGAGKDQLVKSGSSMLGSLLGQGSVDGLLSGLTKNTGLGGAAAATLLPLVGQMAMGGLAKQASGMDASGLANMLMSQKSSFEAAIPSGVADAARTATSTANHAAQQASSGMGGLIRWLIPLAAVLAALWYFLSDRTPTTTTTTAATQATTAASGINIDGVDVTGSLSKTFGDLTTAIGTVTNAETAKAALPKFEEATKAITAIEGVKAKFTPEHKTLLGTLISAGLTPLKAAADKALATEGVGAVLKPVVDGLFAKIEGLAK